MNTKLTMTMSAVVMGATGIVLTFIPQEISSNLNSTVPSSIDVIVLQLLGALYFAFAMTNWAARANLIGGIYGRPIAIGNLTHFVIGALALVKAFFSTRQTIVLMPAIVYAFFAIVFSIIFFTHPVKDQAV